jgi:phosphoglycolate phosphatase-like HAD superfamily hydrolase
MMITDLKVKALIDSAKVVFWDFDGVIKDSLDAKASAYERLFSGYGQDCARRVRQHHEANAGVSRFEKMPLYLCWAGEIVTDELVNRFCKRFSGLVMESVVDSPWVPGVREHLMRNIDFQWSILVTATPQDEIEQILSGLNLLHHFHEVHGAPTRKGDAIKAVLSRLNLTAAQALMIGDAETDLIAAQKNSVSFLLRRTPLNLSLQASYSGPMFENLNDE